MVKAIMASCKLHESVVPNLTLAVRNPIVF